MKLSHLFVVLTCITHSANAQETKKALSILQQLVDTYGVTIRQSATDEDLLEDPATLQFTRPAGGAESSYAVDAGVSAKYQRSPAWSVGPLVEYHRNTETGEEQDTFEAGVTGTYIFGDISERPAHFVQATASYKDDDVGVGSGGLGKIEYYVLIPKWAIGADRGPDAWRLRWQPMIGVQYESGDNVAKTGRSGHTGRATAGVTIRMLPFDNVLDGALEFVLSGKYWRGFSESDAYEELVPDEENVIKVSVNYFFDPDKHVALGLDYTNGGDPAKGRIDQEVTVMALKFQIGGE